MTVANRAIGAPINIWNDHSDTMSQRDCGWIQLYAQTNQEAADLHILAFRLAEELSTPVMVCMDGFVLTHAFEEVDVPTRSRSTPTCRRSRRARCSTPPTRCRSVRWSGPRRSRRSGTWRTARSCGRWSGSRRWRAEFVDGVRPPVRGLVEPYRPEGADTVVVALGSVLGTLQDVSRRAARTTGVRIGALGHHHVPAVPG